MESTLLTIGDNKGSFSASTSLIGHINNDTGIVDDEFLNELEALMKKYKVQKLDISWGKNWNDEV